MGFETKRALLEHMGKNPSDNKLVDRMMLRGEVEFRDWMYYLVESEEVKELKKKISELENSGTAGELAEAKVQRAYYERLYNEEYEAGERRLRKAFDWIKQRVKWVSWEEFHEWVMEDEVPF